MVTVTDLGDDDRREVEDLVADARRTDGSAALNEAGHLHLRHPRPGLAHLLVRLEETLVGYAQHDASSGLSTGQLVVAPPARRRGVGSALLRHLLDSSAGRLQIWALGDPPAAAALARSHELVRVRELLVMIRNLDDPLPEPVFPDGVTRRSFRPGEDEEAWLRLNARAFAGHPEQGALTPADLADRMAEPWFDAAGFLLAEASDPRGAGGVVPPADTRLVGFHWTKQHPGLLGEVYVLGVDPAADGRGLGRALLLAGLHHLAARGNHTVELYVEADHLRAVQLYRGHGFRVASRDVMYAQHKQES